MVLQQLETHREQTSRSPSRREAQSCASAEMPNSPRSSSHLPRNLGMARPPAAGKTKYSDTPWKFSEAKPVPRAVLVYLYSTRPALGRSERGAPYLLSCSILSRRPHSSEMYVPWLHRSFQATHTAVAGQREKQATTLLSWLWVRRNRCGSGFRLRVYPMCLAPLFFSFFFGTITKLHTTTSSPSCRCFAKPEMYVALSCLDRSFNHDLPLNFVCYASSRAVKIGAAILLNPFRLCL